ncbi:MAG: malectin [Acidobacteria bacterium]|nr:malectin [Acidobacteriota bacterium]
MPQLTPSQDGYSAERAELEAVLASKIFTRAPNLSKILAYICDRHFAGDEGSIKEYTIAVEALNRGPDFQPSSDSIVRVEFSRLRRRLIQYYAEEGQDHSILLQVSESGYTPRFVSRSELTLRGATDPQPGDGAGAPAALGTNPPAGVRSAPWKLWHTLTGLRSATLYVILAAVVMAAAFTIRNFAHETAARNSQAAVAASIPAAEESGAIRIAAGSSMTKFVDSSGQAWQADRWFEGGTSIERPDHRINGTFDPHLYRTARQGRFRYRIPVKAGEYELRLHFAEIVHGVNILESGGEGLRRFDVALNGRQLLEGLDIASDAGGPDTADEKIFPGIVMAKDGFLELDFSPFRSEALLSGIEILPSAGGKMRPVRIVTGSRVHYDAKNGFWGADRYFRGGTVARRWSSVRADEPNLYATERWGNFTYSIPVAKGKYTLTLKFAESYFAQPNAPAGARIFDVFLNGVTVLHNFDILKEAGSPNRALDKVFHGLTPNAQDKLIISFVPVRDYAILNAIEVIPE